MPSNDTASSLETTLKYSAPALEKGFKVIQLLAGHPRGLTASEIASGLELSVSEIFRVLVVMERTGWLRKSAGDKYSVTSMVLSLAFRATPAQELSSIAMPHMRELCEISDQSCHLVVRNGAAGLIIARYQNPGPTGFHVRIGSEFELSSSCSGHVLLAFDTLAPFEKAPQAADEALARRLRTVRQQGYQRMRSARTLGVTDISYPVFDLNGHVAAALTVPFLERIDGHQVTSLDETQNYLQQTVRAISREMAS